MILLTFSNHKNSSYLVIQALELLCIFLISNILLSKEKIGQCINNILLLLFNAQLVVLYFGNSYISMIMLSNLHSLEDISGNATIYIIGILLVLFFSFLPISKINAKKPTFPILLAMSMLLELTFTSLSSFTFSPLYSYYDIATQYYRNQQMNTAIVDSKVDNEDSTNFYKLEIQDYRKKDEKLPEQPNIILIFTEGLSLNVTYDEKNITPNISEYKKKSLCFYKYYNHTAATYRGLQGQLYSGYQLNDFDGNNLVSLQGILSDQGYDTFFINVEPHNDEFTSYLNNLGYDEVLIDETFECNGPTHSISDADAYNYLFDVAQQQAKTDKPFFMTIYTLGTHASFDSVDEKYSDGTNAELNKFYNADYQFGNFMNKFESSSLSDNTIIIFTTYHATYKDEAFTSSFPNHHRPYTFCDEIPLFIYYKGIQPESINVNGRNTLCLAPTILDYLDITAPNYFLGSSLFSSEKESNFETIFTETYTYINTDETLLRLIGGDELDSFVEELQSYFIESAETPLY